MRWFITGCLLCSVVVGAEVSTPKFTPSIYAYGVYGTSSADDPGSFAPGGHDPSRSDSLILQSLEPSLSLHWGDYIEGFATGIAFTDENDDLEWEWEEYFLKAVNLPGGLEIRGGRMLSRVGLYNTTHLHSWNTVDAPLAHALFLGEDGLALEGGDLSVHVGAINPTVLTVGFGQRPSHAHEHGHEEEEEDHDEEGEHHDEEEEEHGHGEEGFGALEELRPVDDVFTIGLRHDRRFDDFNQVRFALFGGAGDNEGGEDAWFAGAGVEYQWRENGVEPGGRALRWRTEVISFEGDLAGEHHEEEEEHHDEEEEDHEEEEGVQSISSWGITTELLYEAHERAHPFGRIDYVDSIGELEVSDWIRYTAGVKLPIRQDPEVFVRLQVNADERGSESEQSAWAQLGFGWGEGEVR